MEGLLFRDIRRFQVIDNGSVAEDRNVLTSLYFRGGDRETVSFMVCGFVSFCRFWLSNDLERFLARGFHIDGYHIDDIVCRF